MYTNYDYVVVTKNEIQLINKNETRTIKHDGSAYDIDSYSLYLNLLEFGITFTYHLSNTAP